ncbi:MAG: ribonuclease R [Planctomycetes bacterium]|nr:ribonuclease R [Planctomycetota bacterium]
MKRRARKDDKRRRSDRPAFRPIVKEHFKTGRLIHGWPGAFTGPEVGREVVGTYRGHPRGFGFVVPESPDAHGDLFIPEGSARSAVTGDTVRAVVAGRPGRRGILVGSVVEVLSHGERRFVGVAEREGRAWIVRPDGKRLPFSIHAPDAGAKGIRNGDKVVVELVTEPTGDRPATGAILERLGPAGRLDVDALSILRTFRIPDVFPEAAIEDAREVVAAYAREPDDGGRTDLRDLLLVTIDPDDAKDFDDAISVRRIRAGLWELGVHIADVASFVAEGGPLDETARERGNSVYLPRHVVPMLPEIISNGVASLQEGEDRRARSVFVSYDARARVRGARVERTWIRSARRLTYAQAQAILDGGAKAGDPVARMLGDAAKLARAIEARRAGAGMLSIEKPEIDLVFDEKDRITGVRPSSSEWTHKLIEMFMIEANEAVARILDDAGSMYLRRIHPAPDREALGQLARFVRAFGYEVPARPGRSDLQTLLAAAKEKPEAAAIGLAVLRAMERAVYSPEKEGHFGLASDAYAHFTSPIRRYADLTVHRLLDRLPAAGRRRRRAAPKRSGEEWEALEALGRHISFTERRAEDAERELRTMKVLELLAKRIGETFEGFVSGVASFGLFVTIPEFLTDGLMHVRVLPDDWWEVDRARASLSGTRTGLTYRVGDRIRVRIAAADPPSLRLDLLPADVPAETTRAAAPRRGPKRTDRGRGRDRRRRK